MITVPTPSYWRELQRVIGANVGYVITTTGFQAGGLGAADLTNLRLVTWP